MYTSQFQENPTIDSKLLNPSQMPARGHQPISALIQQAITPISVLYQAYSLPHAFVIASLRQHLLGQYRNVKELPTVPSSFKKSVCLRDKPARMLGLHKAGRTVISTKTWQRRVFPYAEKQGSCRNGSTPARPSFLLTKSICRAHSEATMARSFLNELLILSQSPLKKRMTKLTNIWRESREIMMEIRQHIYI